MISTSYKVSPAFVSSGERGTLGGFSESRGVGNSVRSHVKFFKVSLTCINVAIQVGVQKSDIGRLEEHWHRSECSIFGRTEVGVNLTCDRGADLGGQPDIIKPRPRWEGVQVEGWVSLCMSDF